MQRPESEDFPQRTSHLCVSSRFRARLKISRQGIPPEALPLILRMQTAKAMDRAQDWPGTEVLVTERRSQPRRTPVHPLDGPSRPHDSDRRLGLGRRWDDWRRP
jgi:hypothetical protein